MCLHQQKLCLEVMTGIFLDKHLHTKSERKAEDEWGEWDERSSHQRCPRVWLIRNEWRSHTGIKCLRNAAARCVNWDEEEKKEENKTLRSDIVGFAARKSSLRTRPVATAVCQAGWHVLLLNVPEPDLQQRSSDSVTPCDDVRYLITRNVDTTVLWVVTRALLWGC